MAMPNLNPFDFPMSAGIGMQGASLANYTRDSGGLAFLQGELEKREEKLKEPLTSVDYPRDMPLVTGGGWVDTISSFNVSYGTSGGSADGLMTNDTNEFPVVQADLSKQLYRVFMWGQIVRVGMIEQQKMRQIGRSLDQLFDKGLHLAYDKKLDENVYVGFPALGTYGLINHPDVTVVSAAPATAGGTDTAWSQKTADQILEDVNTAITTTLEASEHDRRGIANAILIPYEQFQYITTRKVGVTGDKSIYTFLMENNILSATSGEKLTIQPSVWCKQAGTGNKDRMVAYRNDKDMIHMDITVTLKRLYTMASPAHVAYLSPYVSQFSQVIFEYITHALYVDGI